MESLVKSTTNFGLLFFECSFQNNFMYLQKEEPFQLFQNVILEFLRVTDPGIKDLNMNLDGILIIQENNNYTLK